MWCTAQMAYILYWRLPHDTEVVWAYEQSIANKTTTLQTAVAIPLELKAMDVIPQEYAPAINLTQDQNARIAYLDS